MQGASLIVASVQRCNKFILNKEIRTFSQTFWFLQSRRHILQLTTFIEDLLNVYGIESVSISFHSIQFQVGLLISKKSFDFLYSFPNLSVRLANLFVVARPGGDKGGAIYLAPNLFVLRCEQYQTVYCFDWSVLIFVRLDSITLHAISAKYSTKLPSF